MSRTHRQDENRITVRSVGRKALSCVMALAMTLSLGMGQPAVYAEEGTETAVVDTASEGLCVHHPEHTAECGYTEGVEGQPCNHVHDESCGYVEGSPEVPCDKGCTDTDGDGVINHSPDCAYRPAVESQPCNHVHDESCGYVEAQPGTPCSYAENGCPYCITSWSWVDPEEMLVEMDGSWGMGMPGVTADTPLTREELQTMLPAQITATADNGDTQTLDITWDLTAIPEEGATGGEYTITASLADETYALTEDAAPLTVTLQLGTSTDTDKTETDTDTTGDTGDLDDTGSTSDVALYTQLPSGDPTQDEATRDRIINGVSPHGTTIDLFDYWISEKQTDADNVSVTDNFNLINTGINNNHALLFGDGMGDYQNKRGASYFGTWNVWSGTGNSDNATAPTAGIVSETLVDGYPELDVNTWNTYSLRGRSGNESLAYLFDPDIDVNGKASYSNVQGLLQVDNEGYYYYDSKENYAVYYKDTNSFTLYDTAGVKPGGTSKGAQFFPFNAATGYHYDWETGKYWMNTATSTDASINHYFGVHMSTRFVQQYGGHTDEERNTPVTYEFSGDDDVWIFIDGKLVADLGGIHDMASVRIDFSTGDIYINDFDENGNKENNEAGFKHDTLKNVLGLSGDILDDNTYHTLDFFYLERGNVDSNMYLKYNLVTIPESSVIKVDQLGNEVSGATFTLYAADDYAAYGETAPAIAIGTTDNKGEFIFVEEMEDGTQYPITIQSLYDKYQDRSDGNGNNLILKETITPDGYRSVGDIGLYFYKSKNGEVLLLSNDVWTEGAYAMPKVTATTANQIQLLQHESDTEIYDDRTLVGNNAVDDPLMFAVVLQKQQNGSWVPVSGDPISGWHVKGDSSWTSILEAARENPYLFQLASSGAYQVEISNLPGDIKTYYHICKDVDQSKYTIGYYYSTAGSLAEANEQNTWRIYSESDNTAYELSRVFSMDVYVSNVKNYLMVQKVDDQGNPVAGATFTLTNEDDNSTSVQTTVESTSDPLNLKGGAVFAGLKKGEYTLQETAAPAGYKINDQIIHVVVDDTGVYADAGAANDDVWVLRGVGSVLRSMVQFAAKDNVDVTLNRIQAQMATGTYQDGSFSWSPAEGKTLSLEYANANKMLDYGVTDPNVTDENIDDLTLSTDVGWSKLVITQGEKPDNIGNASYTDLNTQDITSLFSNTVTVRVGNDRTGNLKISKTVDGDEAPDNQNFTFTVTVTKTDAQGQAQPISDSYVTVNKNSVKGSITFTDGEATVTLKDGEKITILGLPTDAAFTVEESPVSGFTPKVDATVSGGGTATEDEQNPAKATGTIGHDTADANATTLAYTNTYDGSVSVVLNGTKTLQGRNITAGDSFTFTLAADGAATTQAITAGEIILPSPTTATVIGDGNSDTADFAFNAIKFKKEGTYTFKITENLPEGVTAANPVSDSIRYDTHTCTVTVTVEEGATGLLEVDNVTYSDGGKAAFTNRQESLILTKTVTGKLGDRDKGFTFTITLKDANENALQGSYSYIGGVLNGVTGVDAPAGGTVTSGQDITLKHGQTITILGLPVGTQYSIQETNASAEGYTAKVDGVTLGNYTASGTVGSDTVKVNFVNERDGTVPTGIMIDSFPWMMAAGLCLLCAAALLLTWKIRRRNQMNHYHED